MINFNEILILDGATGTQLHQRGLPPGVCPEEWILSHPDAIRAVQKAYKDAGSDAVYAPTFGANRKKLPPHLNVYDTNQKLLALCREAVGEDTLIGGDLSPTGELLYPMGMMTEEELIAIYQEQIRAFYDFGVDFIVIETMMDIREVKCALLAVKQVYGDQKCPVFVTMTLEESGKTLTGTDPLSALLIAEEYGADAFGFNCSAGPDQMIPLIDAIVPYASVPLITKPNAGLPHEENGETVFSMGPQEFGRFIRLLIEHGANIVGGCCGTDPDYIRTIAALKIPVMPVSKKTFSFVTSARSTVLIGEDTKWADFTLTDGIDAEEFCYELADAECDVIRLRMMAGEETKNAFWEALSLTVTPPIYYDTESPEELACIRRHTTGAQFLAKEKQKG